MVHCKHTKTGVLNREGILPARALQRVLTLSLDLAAMLLLPRPGILEPNLRDPLAETGYLSYPLEILPVGIAVHLEVGLQDCKLLLGEGRPHALRFAALAAVLGIAILRRGGVITLDYV